MSSFVTDSFYKDLLIDPKVSSPFPYSSYYLEFYVERPVTIFKKSVPTLLDSILKIGGLLGFIKLISMAMSYVHFRLFQRALRGKCGPLERSMSEMQVNGGTSVGEEGSLL